MSLLFHPFKCLKKISDSYYLFKLRANNCIRSFYWANINELTLHSRAGVAVLFILSGIIYTFVSYEIFLYIYHIGLAPAYMNNPMLPPLFYIIVGYWTFFAGLIILSGDLTILGMFDDYKRCRKLNEL